VPIEKNMLLVVPSDLHYLSTIYLLIKAKWKKTKVISWGHYLTPKQSQFKLFIRYLFWRICDANIFYTEVEVASYEKKYKNKDNIFYLNNGLDYSEIINNVVPYNSKTRQDQIVFIGRLTKKSQFNILLKSLRYIIGKKPIVNVIGEIQSDQISIKDEYVDSIVWHGAILDEKKISEIMNKSLLFVYPGSVGLSLIHAMAYGLPCVIHNNRANHMPEADAFFGSNIGYTFIENSPSSLANAIEKARKNPALLNQLSRNARDLIKNVYNTDKMAKNFFRMEESVLHSINYKR
jgi:glycosyltransferase involved in cell wall biosynthesis